MSSDEDRATPANEGQRKIPLAQTTAEDHAAQVMREKIGDVRELAGGAAAPVKAGAALARDQQELEATIIAAIRTIFDPEIPLNIYDLGLIYKLEIDAVNAVAIDMTLTAPGCPVAGSLVAAVERKVEEIPEVAKATVTLVWDPPWTRERLSEEAKLELGLM